MSTPRDVGGVVIGDGYIPGSTFLFKQLAPDYSAFEKALKQWGTEWGYQPPVLEEGQIFEAYMYHVIKRRWYFSETLYETPGAFWGAFIRIWQDIFDEYRLKIDAVKAIHALSPEDYALTAEVIANVAQGNNEYPADPWQALKYISGQTSTKSKGNKLAAYLNAMELIPGMQSERIARAFGGLFRAYGGETDIFYGGELPPTPIY